jgi:Predicted membrane protein (DUF2207) C-terminal domain
MILELIIAGVGIALWLAVFGACVLLTRPREVQPVAATQDFGGPESPAVVSLLANRWEITEDAAESTLLDLAARKYIELRQPANDPMHTTIHIRQADPGGLTRYEKRVFDRVAGLAAGGVVPMTALTFRDPAQAKGWAKRLSAEVVADARERGLSRRRFSPPVLTALTLAAVTAAGAVLVAMLHYANRTHPHDDPAFGAAFFTFLVLSGIAGSVRGERDTPAGRQVAARWLGLRAYLRGDESFANLPPSAVAVWDRYLAYGDAVGATRVCSAVIDIGMGNRKRVWSSFGGTWHRVRVRYPKVWGRYGAKATPLIFWAVVNLILGFVVLRYGHVVTDRTPGLADLVVLLLGAGLVVRGGYRLVRTVVDLATPLTLTGEALWTEVWRSTKSSQNNESRPWLYYLAVDDGSDDRTTAWGLPSELLSRCEVGDVVRLTTRRWTRRVTDVAVIERGRAGRLVETAATDSTENLIAVAMGKATVSTPAAATLLTPAVAAGSLLTVEEVGRALGRPVTAQAAAGPAVAPASFQTFDANGSRAVYLAVTGGLPGRLALRARKHGTPLPGIGDEAYAGDNWAMARRGDQVVMVRLHQPADPRNVYWLLATAVSRLPAG